MSEPAHTDMTTEERLCARCQHAVPRYLGGGRSRNAALRERLGMDRRNAVRISGVIRREHAGACATARRNAAWIFGVLRRVDYARGSPAMRRNAVRIFGVIRQALRNGLLHPADSTRPARSGYVPFRA